MTNTTLDRTTTVHGTLEAAVRAYETHHNLTPGHYQTSPAANLDGHHLHLRTQTGNRKQLVGAATAGLTEVRIVTSGTCPICHPCVAPAQTFTITYQQIEAAR